jgi:hypothetical protein
VLLVDDLGTTGGACRLTWVVAALTWVCEPWVALQSARRSMREIFPILNRLLDSGDGVATGLAAGRITLIRRRYGLRSLASR